MKPKMKIGILVLAVGGLAILIVLESQRRMDSGCGCTSPLPMQSGDYGNDPPINTYPASQQKLPRMVDLGRTMCIPCKAMAPILEEAKEEYQGRAIIEFIDVGDHPDQARKYGIELIPTQIFLDAEGREVWRHEGFLSKEEIAKQLAEMGVK
jgi:thioredoxin 1